MTAAVGNTRLPGHLIPAILFYVPVADVVRMRSVSRLFRSQTSRILIASIRFVINTLIEKKHAATIVTACGLAAKYERILGGPTHVALTLLLRPISRHSTALSNSALTMTRSCDPHLVTCAGEMLKAVAPLVEAPQLISLWHAFFAPEVAPEVRSNDGERRDTLEVLVPLLAPGQLSETWTALCNDLEQKCGDAYRKQNAIERTMRRMMHLVRWTTAFQRERFASLLIQALTSSKSVENTVTHKLDGASVQLSPCLSLVHLLSPYLSLVHLAELTKLEESLLDTFPVIAHLLSQECILPLWSIIATANTCNHTYGTMLPPLVPLLAPDDLSDAWTAAFDRACTVSLRNHDFRDDSQSRPYQHPLVVVLCKQLAPRLELDMLASICDSVSAGCAGARGIIVIESLLSLDQLSAAVTVCVNDTNVRAGLQALRTLAPRLGVRDKKIAVAYALKNTAGGRRPFTQLHVDILRLVAALASTLTPAQADATVALANVGIARGTYNSVGLATIAAVATALTPARVRETWTHLHLMVALDGWVLDLFAVAFLGLARHLARDDVRDLLSANLPVGGGASAIQLQTLSWLAPRVEEEGSLDALFRLACVEVSRAQGWDLLRALPPRLSDKQLLMAWRAELTSGCFHLEKWIDLFRERPNELSAVWGEILDVMACGKFRVLGTHLCALEPLPHSVSAREAWCAWQGYVRSPYDCDVGMLRLLADALDDADVSAACDLATEQLNDPPRFVNEPQCLDILRVLAPRLHEPRVSRAIHPTLTVSARRQTRPLLRTRSLCAHPFTRHATLTQEESSVAELFVRLHDRMSLAAIEAVGAVQHSIV